MEKTNFIKELFKRRVPQIIGFYIAATWMMIEIGDWMVERFHLAPEITSYIFIGMAFFLPSIFYLAYHYGKPGKDQWKKATFAIVPSNIVIAIVAMSYFVSPVIATEIKVVTDEKGVQQTFEVPKEGSYKYIVNFFWKNQSGDPELDWMQYGIAWMLTKDINRSLFVTAYTPFTSKTMLKKFKKSGFGNALNIPHSMQLNVSRRQFSQYSVSGRFNKENDIFKLEFDIFDVKSGNKLATHQVEGSDVLGLIDEMTIQLKESIGIPRTIGEVSNELPVAEHISHSLVAIKAVTESKVKRYLENDYVSAKKLVEKAIEKDFSFAYAYEDLASNNQLTGKSQDAQKALQEALKHEYKLTTKDKFKLKALSYALISDFESSIKVLDMWLELYPKDIRAHELLVLMSTVTGIDNVKALLSLEQLRILNPEDYSNLKDMAKIYMLTNQLDKAEELLKEYLSYLPERTDVLVQLANVYERAKKFDLARKELEKVALLDTSNFDAKLKLVMLDTKHGGFEQAEKRLKEMSLIAITSEEKFNVLSGYSFYYATQGKYAKVLEVFEAMELNADHLPPLLKILNVDFLKSIHLASLGRFVESHDVLTQAKMNLQSPLDEIVSLGDMAVYIQQGDKDKVSETLVKLEVLEKKHPGPTFTMAANSAKAYLLEQEGNYTEAIKLHEKSLQALSGSSVISSDESILLNAAVEIAKAKNKAKRSSEAEADLLEVIEKFPTMAVAHVVLAEVYLSLNKRAEYENEIRKIDEIWSDADPEYFEYKRFIKLKNDNLNQ